MKSKLRIVCKGCGYTWYPEKERWEQHPNADEPDCPNPECEHYGTGFHPSANSIWENMGIAQS